MLDSALSPPALNLAARQAVFSDALLDAQHPRPTDVIGPAKGKKAEKRFAIYRNNVISGLTEALMAAYPTVLALVGEDFFRAMGPAPSS